MKQTERIAWVIVMLSLMIWHVSGRVAEEPNHSDDVAAAESPRHRERPTPASKAGERSRRERTGGDTAARAGSIHSRSLNALRSSDPVARMSAFLQVLSSCDASGVEQARKALDEMKTSGISLTGEQDLAHIRAGQLMGAELLADRTGKAEDLDEIATLKRQYEGWIQSDPHAARQWLDGLPTGKFRDQMAVAFIADNTKSDPLGSLDLVASLHPSQQAAAAGRVAAVTPMADASALLRKLEANTRGLENLYLETIFTELAGKAAGGNDPAAVSMIEEHLNQPYVSDSALSLVSAAKAKFDPQGALHWAVEIETNRPDRLNHGQVVSNVIQALSLEGLATAENWAATQPDAAPLLLSIEKRKETLQDRLGDENRYDKDD